MTYIMSEAEREVLSELHDTAEKWGGILKAVKVLIIGAFALGVWVTTLEIRQRRAGANSDKNTGLVEELRLWRAASESNRWTIHQHSSYADHTATQLLSIVTTQQEQNKLVELRIQRMEGTQEHIAETLEKLDQRFQDARHD